MLWSRAACNRQDDTSPTFFLPRRLALYGNKTNKVYVPTKNYRVQCEEFKALLERVRKAGATQDDAAKLMKLHYVFYRKNADFKRNVENHDKTMWPFSNNADERGKMLTSLLRPPRQRKFP